MSKDSFTNALKHRVILQSPQHTVDGFGGVTTNWVALATLWAAIDVVQPREVVRDNQITNPVLIRVQLRYRSDITPAMRLVWQGQAYAIRQVVNHQLAGFRLDLLCEQGVAI
jgi:SPP1 family predicted phage head-tail adaptor